MLKHRGMEITMKKLLVLGVASMAMVISMACSNETPTSEQEGSNEAGQVEPVTQAIAVLTPTEGNTVAGTVKFVQNGSSVKVIANLEGLEPNSSHGWHIHEYGDISGADGTAAGGHYNPEDTPHGLPPSPDRHAGDLGNIKADAEGRVQKEISVDNISINGTQNPILGRGFIVHAKLDDGSQPTGDAGARMAQGVIGVQNPQ